MEFQHRHWRSSNIVKEINTDNTDKSINSMSVLNVPAIWQGGKSEETQKKITVLGFGGVSQYTIKEAVEMLKAGRIFNNGFSKLKDHTSKPLAKKVM
jgi:hypothetical protein